MCWCTTFAPGCDSAWALRMSNCGRSIHASSIAASPAMARADRSRTRPAMTRCCRPWPACARCKASGASRPRSSTARSWTTTHRPWWRRAWPRRCTSASAAARASGGAAPCSAPPPTKEGYLYISANTPHFWSALCDKVGLPELAANQRYDSVRKRARHVAELLPRLHQALAARSALEWEALFGQAVPCAAARTTEDMFDHPQVIAEDMLAHFTHPVLGNYRGFTRAIRFERTPGPDPFAAPTLGQHTEAMRAVAATAATGA